MRHHFCLSLLLAVCLTASLHAQQAAFDHVVIVIEENHSYSDIIGNSAAPNINALAASSANIVNASTDPQGNTSGSHAVRHLSRALFRKQPRDDSRRAPRHNRRTVYHCTAVGCA